MLVDQTVGQPQIILKLIIEEQERNQHPVERFLKLLYSLLAKPCCKTYTSDELTSTFEAL